jgi:hypothetical protein
VRLGSSISAVRLGSSISAVRLGSSIGAVRLATLCRASHAVPREPRDAASLAVPWCRNDQPRKIKGGRPVSGRGGCRNGRFRAGAGPANQAKKGGGAPFQGGGCRNAEPREHTRKWSESRCSSKCVEWKARRPAGAVKEGLGYPPLCWLAFWRFRNRALQAL